MKKANISKPRPSGKTPKITRATSPRIFGSAKGQIVFKKGWDAPMTKRELDQFTKPGDLGPDLRKLRELMKAFRTSK